MVHDELDRAFSLVLALFIGLGALLFLGAITFFVVFAEMTLVNFILVFLASLAIAAVAGGFTYAHQKQFWK